MFIANTHSYDISCFPLKEWADKFYIEYQGHLCACRWVEIRVPMQHEENNNMIQMQTESYRNKQLSYDIFVCGHGVVTFTKGYNSMKIYRRIEDFQLGKFYTLYPSSSKTKNADEYGESIFGDELLYRMYKQHNQTPFFREGDSRCCEKLYYWKWDGTKAYKVGVRCPDYIIINDKGYGYSNDFSFQTEKRYYTERECMADNQIQVIDFEGEESSNGYKFLKVSPFI